MEENQKKISNSTSVAFGVLASLLMITSGLTIYSFVKCTSLETRLSKLERLLEDKIQEFNSPIELTGENHHREKRDTTDQLANLPLHELLSLRGPPGRDGKDGKDGQDGAPGTPGRDGPIGAPGRDGQDGRDGRDGQDGSAGSPGRDGEDGAPGRDGSDGDDGRDGVDGTNCNCVNSVSVTPSNASSPENRQNNSLSNQLAQVMQRIEELRTKVQRLPTENTATSHVQGGSTYIRWGRTSCGNNSQLIYHGFAAGQFYTHQGGSAEYTCLPLNPEFNQWTGSDTGGWIYGAEYESGSHGMFPPEAHQKNVPCSQCYTPARSATIMIPAKRTCPDSWTKEYEGYLMTADESHKQKSNYACVDAQPEYIAGSHANTNGALFYFVQAECATTQHCPPYIQSAELTCVVCSK